MNYMGRLLSNFKGFYNEINSATLTGAIDILVIRREDGSYVTTPWHVRFGKMGVLRSREKVVDVEVNNMPVDIHMKLGEAGEAFFVQEAEIMQEVPPYLATSPIPSHLELMEQGLEEMKRAVEAAKLPDDDITPTNHPRSNTLTQDDINRGMLLQEEEQLSIEVDLPAAAAAGGDDDDERLRPLLRDESRMSSIYQSVNNSLDMPDDDEDAAGKATEAGTQTDMTGMEAETKAYEVCQNRVLATSADALKPGGQMAAAAAMLRKTNSSGNLGTDFLALPPAPPSPRDPAQAERNSREQQKKRRRKRADLLKMRSSSHKSESVRDEPDAGVEEEENIFDLELSEDEGEEQRVAIELSNVSRTVSMPIIETKKAMTDEWADTQFASSCHPFSDGDLTPIVSPVGTRPPSPKSDTELDHQKEATSQTALSGDELSVLDDVKWEWGELPQKSDDGALASTSMLQPKPDDTGKPSGGLFKFMRNTKKIRHKPEEEGIYLDDLNLEEMDPEVAALYLYHPSKHSTNQMRVGAAKDEDNESGRGASLPQSPVTIGKDDAHTDDLFAPLAQKSSSPDIGMSLCGGLEELESGDISTEKFMRYLITYDQFCEKPSLMADPSLVIRIADKYYNWQVAGPVIMSVLAFQRPLPDSATDSLLKQFIPKKQRRRGWLWWGRTSEPGPAPLDTTRSTQVPSNAGSAPNSTPSSPRKHIDARGEEERSEVRRRVEDESTGDESDTSDISIKVVSEQTQTANKFKKTLKLSSDELAGLHLKDGANEVTFSVTTQYQGTCRCSANIYLWNWDDKIIVSDIDGTITRSDVLGQVLPMIGKDWSQVGIANLYNLVANNGYRFVYLSARAIGQSKITRDYLRSIRQGELSLPDGPLMLSPSSLISAFHKEVIERKPEEFKISCLRDIIALFPNSRNPLYAGFGNKINDVWAYRSVGIPLTRIFTVNHRGELKSEMISNFISSYNKLSDIVDHFFPPLLEETTRGKYHSGNFPSPDEFSTFTYWREPLPDIDIDLPMRPAVLRK